MGKIKIGTRLWVTETPDYRYCTEVLVYTHHTNNIFAVDKKGKTYHIMYEHGIFTLDNFSKVSFIKEDDAFYIPLI